MTAHQAPLIRVDPDEPDPAVMARAADILQRGGLVAFPTETVYGLGANAVDARAAERIFEAKGRPASDPLIVHVLDSAGARALARRWPEAADRLAQAFWPGPLTLVVPKRDIVPSQVTAGLDTVALRVPVHPVARALIAAAGLPIAAPSANRFSELSPTRAEHVARALGDRVDLIIDGGPTTVGIESTVVDVSGEQPVVLRPGTIPAPDLAAAAGSLGVRGPAERGGAHAAQRSPGMLARHYSPRAALFLFDAAHRADAERVAGERAARGERVGALLLTELEGPVHERILMPGEPLAYARVLYHALHTLDEHHCDVVLVESGPDTPRWTGIRDRLARAARPADGSA